ncbi:hypothetical protein B0H21DRAFT_710616 [Amylocystis lapponica]|nr:hypothetical protein B0H21DRAFT_710616 [Amylocystis lapponica]
MDPDSYARHLFHAVHGYPLYYPEPGSSGECSVGDVCTLLRGSLGRLCNIQDPAVPSVKCASIIPAGPIYSSSVTASGDMRSGSYTFECNKDTGAFAVLKDDAVSDELHISQVKVVAQHLSQLDDLWRAEEEKKPGNRAPAAQGCGCSVEDCEDFTVHGGQRHAFEFSGDYASSAPITISSVSANGILPVWVWRCPPPPPNAGDMCIFVHYLKMEK